MKNFVISLVLALFLGGFPQNSRVFADRLVEYNPETTRGRLVSENVEVLGSHNGFLGMAGNGSSPWIEILDVKRESYTSLPLPESEKIQINAICPLSADSFWLGTNNGLFHFKNGRYQLFDTRHGLPHVDIRMLKPDSKGEIWVGLFGGYLGKMSDGGVPNQFIPTAGRAELNSSLFSMGDIQAVAVVDMTDLEGEKFLALSSRGIGILNQSNLYRDFDQKDYFKSSWVNAVSTTHDGVYVGTSNGLFHIQGSTAKAVESVQGKWVTALSRGNFGKTWVGTREGLILLDSQANLIQEYSKATGDLKENEISSLSYDESTLSLFASTKKGGLYRFIYEKEFPAEPIAKLPTYKTDQIIFSPAPDKTENEILGFIQTKGFVILEQNKELGVYLVSTGSKDSQKASAELSSESKWVKKVEPNYLYYKVSSPSDPFFRIQQNLRFIGAEKAWDKHQGDPSIVLAVLDTGADTTHQDLKNRMLPGRNFVEGGNDVKDDHGHGTHVSGIAMAESSNGLGVSGVDWKGSVLPVRVLGLKGGSSWGIARGIFYAAGQGADVINMSLGGAGSSWFMEWAVKYARSKGTVVVAAMGNDNSGNPFYPAAYPGVLAVGAVDNTGRKAPFSNYGAWMAISAPGVRIPSTYTGPYEYAYLSGTSMASPHVAGAIALFLGQQKKERGYKKSSKTPDHILKAVVSSGKKGATGENILNLEALLNQNLPRD